MKEIVTVIGVLEFALIQLKRELQKEGFEFLSVAILEGIVKQQLAADLPQNLSGYTELIVYNAQKIASLVAESHPNHRIG